MPVLSDRTIREQLSAGRIIVEPLDENAIQPASIDLRLDDTFRIFKVTTRPYVDVREPVDDLTELVAINRDQPFILQPGAFCLATTLETITLPGDLVARVDRPYGSPGLGSKYRGQSGPTPSRISEDFQNDDKTGM